MDQNKQSNQDNKNLPDSSGGGDKEPKRSGFSIFNVILIIMMITIFVNLISSVVGGGGRLETTYNQFLSMVDAGYVGEVVMTDDEIEYTLNEDASLEKVTDVLEEEESIDKELVEEIEKEIEKGKLDRKKIVYTTGVIENPDLIKTLDKHGVNYRKVVVQDSPIFSFILSWVIPFVILYFIYYFFMRSMRRQAGGMGGAGGMFGVGKSTAKEYSVEKDTGFTFDDVAGQDEAKESLREIIDFLHNPERYQEIGARQPKGALLVGPPGTGKTLIAKAVAGEAKVPFFHLSGSEFIEMFVGVGASRVRDLFKQAGDNAPAIIFIDEIDAIGKTRDTQMSTNDEREQTLNQLLAEMDGFDPTKGVVVLAATNRPEVLDKALLRPGRFDRQIPIDLPDLPGREAILKVHAKDVRMGSDVNLNEVALATVGASGADLANMINEAALRAVKMGRNEVAQEDLMESVEVVIAGQEKKDRVMNEKERRMVAFHEVGHALVTALQKKSQPVQKITIVPRTKGSLGYTMSLPEEERYLKTKEELLAEINTLMGGRAAELLVFGTETTGASNDIERATKLARAMVTQYGMSDEFGPVSMEDVQSQYLDGRAVSTVSENTNARVDNAVQQILLSSQQQAKELLETHRAPLDAIAEYLLEKETITGDEFMKVLEESRDDQSANTQE